MQKQDLQSLFERSLKRRIKEKFRPESIINYHIKQVNQDFEDVVEYLQDYKSQYHSTVPAFILKNSYNLKRDEYETFKNNYLKKKRQLEMNVIKHNMEQETLDEIIELIDPPKTKKQKQRQKLKREVRQKIKNFAKQTQMQPQKRVQIPGVSDCRDCGPNTSTSENADLKREMEIRLRNSYVI